ncbi:MAG: amino acid--tRNA ligase-related protein, partial [bacterium]
LTQLVTEIRGAPQLTYQGHTVDFSKWQRLSMREAICEYWLASGAKPKPEDLADAERARRFAEQHDKWAAAHPDEARPPRRADVPSGASAAIATQHLFEAVVERRLIQPTLIYDFPTEISPLSKARDDDPSLTERFEIFAGGLELGNAFSELNDPLEQRQRFLDQVARRAGGDLEAHVMDDDYVRALAYALPPTAGEGVGIDRLVMLLTDSRSIRDVILFPLLRPLHLLAASDKPE